jgi:hypothetical protein
MRPLDLLAFFRGAAGLSTARSTPRLYKYRRPPLSPNEHGPHRSLILEGQLWFAKPSTLNDPYDCRPLIVVDVDRRTAKDLIQRLVDRTHPLDSESARQGLITQKTNHWQESETYHSLVYDGLDRFGVVSLACTPTCPLMWAHYAGDHTGYCAEIEWNAVSRGSADGVEPEPVCYAAERPRLKVSWLTKLLDKDPNWQKTLLRILCTKSGHWEYEGEYRLISPGCGGTAKQIQPTLVTAVVLGARMTPEHRTLICDWVVVRNRYCRPHCAVYQAKLSRRSFAIELSEVDPRMLASDRAYEAMFLCGTWEVCLDGTSEATTSLIIENVIGSRLLGRVHSGGRELVVNGEFHGHDGTITLTDESGIIWFAKQRAADRFGGYLSDGGRVFQMARRP